MEVFIGSGKPPPDVKNFGDAALAKKVMEAVAEGVAKEQVTPYNAETTFTYQKCARLGIRARQCQDLQEIFMTSIFRSRGDFGLIVTPEEQRELEGNGFSREFIGALAGPDGAQVLGARIEWLRKNVVKYEVPENFSTHERKAMLKELGDIGLAAADAVSYIMALGASELAPDVWETVSGLEKNPLALLSYSGKICSGTQWGLAGLIAAVQSSDSAQRSCALSALKKIGRAAPSAAPILVEEYRRRTPDKNQRELCLEIVETFRRVASPTLETIKFYREIFRKALIWGDHDSQDLVVEGLMELLKTAEPTIRLRIFDILMEMGGSRRLKFYLPALTSSNATRRGNAIFDLSMEKEEANAPLFFAALHHPRRILRRRALKAIGSAKRQTVSVDDIRLLIGWLSHRNPEIRSQAAKALAAQGEKAKYALPFLSAMQNDAREKKWIREAAAEAIAEIEEAAL